jgi:CheY-like chemotaxis protein
MAALETVPFDVLVTDVNLPGASGQELAQRARLLRPSSAIVFATGDPSHVRNEISASVLAKPYTQAQLLSAVSLGQSFLSSLEEDMKADDIVPGAHPLVGPS